MKLQVQALSWAVLGQDIVQAVDLSVGKGECIGIIGPNGSGKSSLLRCISRVTRPHSGTILLDGDDVWQLKSRQFARRAAAVSQEMPGQLAFTVREIAAMGRYPHKGLLERDNSTDVCLVDEALKYVGMLSRAERSFSSLSGGEKQRTLIARAIAQETEFLILDEPTNHLDIYYQLEIMELIRGLDCSCLMVMHDLNLAARYCDRLYVMFEGRVLASGPPQRVLTPELIQRVYRVASRIIPDPDSGRPYILFHRSGQVPARPSFGPENSPSS